MPDEVTHIVLESEVITEAQLMKKLNCDGISPKVFIVRTNWLIDCNIKLSRLDESLYKINLGLHDSGSSTSTRKTSSSSDSVVSNESPNKRQKFSAGHSKSFASPADVAKHPIIANPIYYPSFSPKHGSWQEHGSIMYKFTDPSDKIKDLNKADSIGETGVTAFNRKFNRIYFLSRSTFCMRILLPILNKQ